MQILIQGSDRRIKLTKGEVRKLKAAATLLNELSNQCMSKAAGDAGAAVEEIVADIDAKGEYKPAALEESK